MSRNGTVKRIARVAAGIALLCVAATARAQVMAPQHAKVTLISEDNALTAGKTEWIGVLFDMDKGWHIYWQNPGDSGMPPRLMWQLPEGFSAGEIRWPAPERLSGGTLVDYGYQGRVLLPVELHVPATYKGGPPPTIAADVHYLICREVCVPAKAHVSLAIPAAVSAADAKAHHDLFAAARAAFPKPMAAAWKTAATYDGKQFVLSIESGKSEPKAVFFPMDADQIDNAAPQSVAASADGVKITLKKSDQLQKPISKLRGVVEFAPGRAYEISAPVRVKP